MILFIFPIKITYMDIKKIKTLMNRLFTRTGYWYDEIDNKEDDR
jgi:hypothetical protein